MGNSTTEVEGEMDKPAGSEGITKKALEKKMGFFGKAKWVKAKALASVLVAQARLRRDSYMLSLAVQYQTACKEENEEECERLAAQIFDWSERKAKASDQAKRDFIKKEVPFLFPKKEK